MEKFERYEDDTRDQEIEIRKECLKDLLSATNNELGDDWFKMLLNPESHKYAAKIDKVLIHYGFNRADFYLKVLYMLSLGKMPKEFFEFDIYINKVEENN